MNEAVRHLELDDKYTLTSGRVFMNGLQALVRLPMEQIRRDRAAGLDTAAFISGYRGSPLGGFDQQLAAAKRHLDAHQVVVKPAVNEDLAATAVWGTQQVGLSPGARHDGVVGIWYGKGPGVDRSGDVLKHGNAAGSSKHGGVLCLAGDDHGAKSSTVPHQSDHAFMSALIPVLYPSSIHEFIDYGLLGIAMSRYSGCWVGMKIIADTVETTSTVDVGAGREFVIPADFEIPPGGLNLRWPDDRWSQDRRLQNFKGYAAIAFARANKVDRIVFDSPHPRFGIVASGKAYEDTRQALRELGIDAATAARIGLRLYKVGMPWPLEPEGIRHFSEGLQEVLVVEERREIIENQIKQQLFNWRADVRPRIVGKFDHHDKPVLPLETELSAGLLAEVIADRLVHFNVDPELKRRMEERLAWFDGRLKEVKTHVPPVTRLPYYCSGCPHNTSTKVIEGSRALAGIGCHFMVTWMDRRTDTFTHMGGEGVPWMGIAPFTDEKHIFANMGDGTYFHSGLLAIRQSVAAGNNITYKILFNDAVAMTGGQAVDGQLTVPQLAFQVRDEGVTSIYLVSDNPPEFEGVALPPGTILRHRDDLEEVQREMRELPGCTVMIYHQTCAAEKRRKRKRGLMEDPPRRVFINDAVCEGCGDCSVQSNCVSVEPLETELGRKRKINQSSCNKDYSCLKGFCPSFVTVHGGEVRKASRAAVPAFDLPEPESRPELDQPYNIGITGIGGTGVLTIGAILGMASHLEGKAAMVLDMAGLAQKGGAVLSHVRLGRLPEEVTSPRIVVGGADLLLAADSVVAVSKDGLGLSSPSRTHAVVNGHLAPVADFVRKRDFDFRQRPVEETLSRHVRPGADFVDFTGAAEAVMGDAIATNIMMVGFAYQRGLLPLSAVSIGEAIRLNGVAVKATQLAFDFGRLLAADPAAAEKLIGHHDAPAPKPQTLDELIARREAMLRDYQDDALAERYRSLVQEVRARSAALGLGEKLGEAAARYYFKLLAYKDEYEVARLFTTGDFERKIAEQFDGNFRLSFHLAPPFLPGTTSDGRPKKREFGRWMLPAFRMLARFKRLRGTALDPFGYSEERREERRLIADYETTVKRVLAGLQPAKEQTALELLTLPDEIRGFGPVKMAAIKTAEAKKAKLMAEFDAAELPLPQQTAA